MKTPACPQCQSLYSVKFKGDGGRPGKHPLLLRCGHTFCETCIQKCSSRDDSIKCPACQAPTKVESGADLYKFISPDLYTVGLIWARRMELEIQSQKIRENNNTKARKKPPTGQAVGKTDASPCSECHVSSATCQCIKCDCILCRPCFDKIHQMYKSLKKHQPLPLPDSTGFDERLMALKKTRSRNCSTHEQCQIEYFCNDDKQAICSRCVIVGGHKGHDVQTMEDKNKEYLSEIEPAILAAQETIWRLEKSEKIISQAMPSAQLDSKSLVEEVRGHFQHLHSMLQAREEQLLDDIREASLCAAKPFQDTKAYLQTEKLNLEMAVMDGLRTLHGSIHQLVDADLVLERLKKAKDTACVATVQENAVLEPIKFSFEAKVKDFIGSYGDITTMNPNQMFTLHQPGPDAERPPAEELRTFSLSDLDMLSTTTDSESIADTASVFVEEEEKEEEPVAAEEVNIEATNHVPGKRLVTGHQEKVSVTHIRTPRQFYVQLASRQVQLGNLQRQINHHCRSQQGKKSLPQHVEEGMLVLAQFSHDKNWYRAIVTKVVEPDGSKDKGVLSYEVFFMDYGNSEMVTLQKLRQSKKKFEANPAFAYECALYDILPVDEAMGWTSEAVKVMLEMTRAGHMVMMVINTVGGLLEVDLSKPPDESHCVDDRPVSVRDCLVFLELAIFNTYCPHDGGGPRLKRDYMSLPRVPDGMVVDVGINCVHTPSLFYVQMFSEQSIQHLQQQLLSMQEYYKEETRHLYTIFCPRKGMICVARYSKDNCWYRARVTGLPGSRKVEVMFVDYGNTEVVDHSDLCKILDVHIRFPQQALASTLADVEPVEHGLWSDKANSWFQSVVNLQFCQFRVTAPSSQANSMKGVLYCFIGGKLCCANYELVRRGFAKSTGFWSQKETFSGITLSPDMVSTLSPTSSPSKANHCPPHRQRHSPSQATLTPPSSSSSSSSPALSPNSKARRRITLKNLHKNGEIQGGGERVKDEGKRKEATCRPGGGAVEVLVSGYQNPAHFFIQLQEKQPDLLKLMEELAAYETETPSDCQWKAEAFCVAKFSVDDRWYRGRINRQLEDNTYEVSFIDYGHVDTVPASQLRPMKKAHSRQECFAERCHLAGLVPAGSTNRTKWSATAIEFMADQVRAKRLFVSLKGDVVAGLGLPVDLLIEVVIPETAFDPPTHQYVSLVSQLTDKGLAIPCKGFKRSESASEPPPSEEPFHSQVISTLPEPSRQDNMIAQSTFQCGGAPATSPDLEPVDSVYADEGELATTEDDGEPVTIVQPDYEVCLHPPPSSTTLTVLPVFVDYEGIIYAHDFEEGEQSMALVERLDEYCRKEAPKGVLEVKVGQICLAHYDTDNAWYRARVLEVGQSNVKVKYIDYGNTARVDRTMLKLITPDLCTCPQVAYEFKLHNLRPDTVEGTWPVSFLEYMHKQLVNQQCSAIVKGKLDEHPLSVELITGEGQSIGEMLLQIGVVVRENDMEDLYQQSADITAILQVSNPYFPLRPGDKGDVFHGLVTHVELPNLVYLQRCAAADTELPEDVKEFVQMMEDLNNLPAQTPALQDLPATGEMCSACFSQDQRWYRGLVAKTYPADNAVLVFYVDYGNAEVVPLDRLRVLPQRFQDTPAQAIRGYLNVDLPHGAKRWTLSTYNAVVEAILCRPQSVHIKHAEPLTVELFSTDDQMEGMSVLSYQQLINTSVLALPDLVTATDHDEDVMVESYTEVEAGETTTAPVSDQ